MALKNLMGLVCDPVAGLVEVPCIKRNVIGAVNAIAAADMALAGIESRIPVDRAPAITWAVNSPPMGLAPAYSRISFPWPPTRPLTLRRSPVYSS